jgi:hypothetical protein
MDRLRPPRCSVMSVQRPLIYFCRLLCLFLFLYALLSVTLELNAAATPHGITLLYQWSLFLKEAKRSSEDNEEKRTNSLI